MNKHVIGLFVLLFWVTITTHGQTNDPATPKDSTQAIRIKPKASQGEQARLKLGAGVFFLKNPTINDALQTQSFFTPNIALEVKGKRFGLQFELGFFSAESTLDTTIYRASTGSNSQFFSNVSLLQTLPLSAQVSFRGTIGFGLVVNNTSGFRTNEASGLSINTSVGLEFHTTSSFSYFIDLRYRHYRSPDIGQLGGITLNFGVIIGPKPR
mgnify:CR=1 FL=1